MKIYKQFLEFINKNYKNFIFVAVFYSLLLASKYALAFDPRLLSFPGRMIGEATLNAYDISKRIHVFYLTGIIFFSGIAFFSFIMWRASIYSERFLKSPELQILNYSSIAGIIFYFFNLWTHSFASSFELIYCIHKIVIVGFAFKWLVLKDKPATQLINISFFSISFVLGVSVFFILTETSLLFELFPKPNFLVVLFTTSILTIVSGIIFIKKVELNKGEALLNKFAFLLVPLVCIPVLSFFKDEISLILNRHEIYFLSTKVLYLCLLFIVAIVILWRYKHYKIKKSVDVKTNEDLIAKRYFPLLVGSLSIFTFYQPIIDISNEMFEAGNQILPIMEFQKFGVVPVFEKFNSHNLSELFFGGIYTFFNGLHSREIYIYEFLLRAFWASMVYYFVYKLSKNGYIALFTIFFFPLIDLLLFDSIIISLLALFITNKVIREEQSFKNYFLLLLCFVFLFFWRVDVGYPSVIASSAVLLTYQMNHEKFQINFKLFFKTLTVFLGIVFIALLAIGWCRDINVFTKLWNGLNYLASSQSYGVTFIGDTNLSVYKMEYFVFPLFIILGIGILLVLFKKFNLSVTQSFAYASFLFLAVYYVVNFQRGLVRHGFNEGGDGRFSSFSFFFFSGCVFLVFYNRSNLFKLIAFTGISIFLLMNYKFPTQTEFNNLYSKIAHKTEGYTALVVKPNMSRCSDTTDFETKYFGDFKKFISKNLSTKQTFIDFSNLPMLYYFTEKISPSYFYQNPLSVHNDYLQHVFIKQLSEYDAPLIVFSNFPKNWWDNVDGVANTLRHYKMAEYFYLNYKPFGIVNNLCIWKKNDFNIENKQKVLFSYSRLADSSQTESSISYKVKQSEDEKHLLQINYKNTTPEIYIQSDNAKRIVTADFNNELMHSAYYIVSDLAKVFSISIAKSENIEQVKFISCEVIPDFYSAYPQKQDLLELPYIWGMYDNGVSDNKPVVSLSASPVPFRDMDELHFNFNSLIDKSSGNTVMISIQEDNAEVSFVSLKYGGKDVGQLGEFIFKVPPGKGVRTFAVRISSQYNWFDTKVDYISLVSWPYKQAVLKKLEIIKAQ